MSEEPPLAAVPTTGDIALDTAPIGESVISKKGQKKANKAAAKTAEKEARQKLRAEAEKEKVADASDRKCNPVPEASLVADSAGSHSVMPTLERDHVQKVYDAVAEQWHGTRYKAWPRVVNFVEGLPARSLVADLGCGNGKMAPACRDSGHCGVGCDFSSELVRIAALQMGLQAQTADVMRLPYRSGTFDAAMSIAVLHHISTPERRQLLVSEALRVLRPGGFALFYAWAADQAEGKSGHKFVASDVFVPFHSTLNTAPHSEGDARSELAAEPATTTAEQFTPADRPQDFGGVFDEAKRAFVFQRYCHVYVEGELRDLITAVGGSTLIEEYYDTGNWCAVIKKDE